ncbi:aspartyl protease family protein At5g10770-like [Oryza brachyantha]|uniref:Peptidase A1 domain-containing protein n=1 Tax=Oryza brachyantha TaxID=4533 RepID=J3MDI9_ORYBR|nr:aspartyl protease family protein At5g10770-like [Oryza brachyantha]
MALSRPPPPPSSSVLVCVLVLVLSWCRLLRGAPPPRYLAASLDELRRSSNRGQVHSPPLTSPAAASGSKLTIHAPVTGQPAARDISVRDRARLRTLLQRSTSTSAASSSSFAPYASPPAMPPNPAVALAPAATIPDRSGADLDTLEFLVVVGLGSPAQTSALIFDTGSDLSWVQCQPCSGHCFPQQDPLFDPTKSSTYAAVPCGDPQCAAAGNLCGENATCLYRVQYGDGSSTTGVLSRDTLTLTSSRTLSGFPFGCGQTNLGDFGRVDGLLGLGRGQLSLPSQAAASFGAVFSYCLPSFNTTPGYLTIGATPVDSSKVQYTAMAQRPQFPSFYFVELVSIDIGGFVVPVPPAVFTSTGTLLDSGTVLTYLPPPSYALLRDRFRLAMRQYRPAPPDDILDACYDFTGVNPIVIPAVSFRFSDGAVFDLGFFGVMIFVEESIGCLAFAARDPGLPLSIIGNTQQRSAEVIYDVAAEKIGFVPGSC